MKQLDKFGTDREYISYLEGYISGQQEQIKKLEEDNKLLKDRLIKNFDLLMKQGWGK